jgi:hypothetical protein
MADETDSLVWLDDENAPLLLVSRSHVADWEGIDPPSNGRIVKATFRWGDADAPATDYDRACDVNDYLGLLSVGNGTGLILNDMPMTTAWRAFSGNKGGWLIRYWMADSEADVLAAFNALPNEIWEDTGTTFTVDTEPLYVFEVPENGKDLDSIEHLTMELSPGDYSIETAVYETKSAGLVAHRFLPKQRKPIPYK